MTVGDKVTCSARWVYGWRGVIIEVGDDCYKVQWNDKTSGECWVEASYLTLTDETPLTRKASDARIQFH